MENYLATYEPHAFVVVLSVTERSSYLRAEEVLQYLWRLDVMNNKGVILVANKTDIVRSRCVSSKGEAQGYFMLALFFFSVRFSTLHFWFHVNFLMV